MTSEYVFFGGKRIARRDASNNIYYYAEDFIGSSRVMTTSNGTVCYEADFYPFGGERTITNTCPQNYKFQGKERDAETGNDDFGARYYSSSFGSWLSPNWSAIPAPVPYADLTNPQTLNLYQFVKNDPETFTDPDGHNECGPSCMGLGGMFDNASNGGRLGDISPVEQAPAKAPDAPNETSQRIIDHEKAAHEQAGNGDPHLAASRPPCVCAGPQDEKIPQDVQKDIDDGRAPSATQFRCPNCKYYPKDVQKAIATHEARHMMQEVVMGLVGILTCRAVTSCRRQLELDAYKAESKYVNKRLTELKARQAKAPLSPEDQISLRVLTTMKEQVNQYVKYPSLATTP